MPWARERGEKTKRRQKTGMSRKDTGPHGTGGKKEVMNEKLKFGAEVEFLGGPVDWANCR